MKLKNTLTGIVAASMIAVSGCGDDPEPQPAPPAPQPTQQVPQAAPQPQPEYRTHTVQQGEWVYDIVRQDSGLSQPALNERVREVCEYNNLANCDHVRVGQELRLPYHE